MGSIICDYKHYDMKELYGLHQHPSDFQSFLNCLEQ